MARGLLGIGREQKRQALAGLYKSAQLEEQRESLNRQIRAQREAAEMQVAGTVGGISAGALLTGAGTGATAAAGTGTAAAGTAAAAGAGTAGTAAAGTAGTAAAGTAAAGGGATILAALPWVGLAIAGGYLLKKIFD